MDIYKKLYEEAEATYDEIGKLEVGSEQHVKAVNCANNMVGVLNEHDRIVLEKRKLDVEEAKLDIELAKLKSENQFRWVPHVITGFTTALTLGMYAWTVLSERKFEAGGHMLTSEAGRTSRRALLSLRDMIRR
jgi:hypothetical protein